MNLQAGNFEKGNQQLEYGLRLLQADINGTELADSIDVAAIRGDPIDWIYGVIGGVVITALPIAGGVYLIRRSR